jgi:hypothetical protein
MRIEFGTRRVYLQASDSVTAADIAAARTRRMEFDVLEFEQLVDLRDATFGLTVNDLPDLANAYREALGGRRQGRIALVVGTDVAYGALRDLESRLEFLGSAVKAFRTVEEADRWLSRPPAPQS